MEKGKSKGPREEGDPSDNLYICGLPAEFDDNSVSQFFGAIGNVIQCKSFGNGYALVRFSSMEEAMTVKMSLNGQMPIGCTKPMVISFAVSDGGKNDWACPRCGDMQFAKNRECRLCACPRPASAEDGTSGVPPGGKGSAKSSYGPAASGGGVPKRAMCKFFLEGTCNQGLACRFAHAEHEIGTLSQAPDPSQGPYGAEGLGSKGTGKVKGLQCSIADFINELVSGGLPGGDQDPGTNCVYVGGLPPDTTTQNLYEIFATFGSIPPKGTTIEKDVDGQCAGWGLVNFIESTSADMAVMALNGIDTNMGKMEVRKK